MPKDRDWIDYSNLGSNVLQNLQLSSLQDKVGAMASAAEAERGRAEREDILRDLVFQCETRLRDLRGRATNERGAVLAMSASVPAMFRLYHLTTSSFRSFEDKERLRSMLEGYEGLTSQCEAALSTEERAEAHLCAEFMAYPRIKDETLENLEVRLSNAESQLRKLIENKENRETLVGCGTVALFIGIGLCIVCLLCYASESEHSDDLSNLATGATISILFGGFGLWLVLRGRRQTAQNPGQTSQNDELAAKKNEIQGLQQEIKTERVRIRLKRETLMLKVGLREGTDFERH